MFRYEVTPRNFRLGLLVLGAFGLASNIWAALNGGQFPLSPSTRVPVAVAAAFSVVGGLLLAAGLEFRRPSPRAWWLSWSAMGTVAIAGSLLPADIGMPSHELPQEGAVGAMLVGAGLVFLPLANRAVVSACFPEGASPAPVFGAAPFLLVMAGAVLRTIGGGLGRVGGPLALAMVVFNGSWALRPVGAVLKRSNEW